MLAPLAQDCDTSEGKSSEDETQSESASETAGEDCEKEAQQTSSYGGRRYWDAKALFPAGVKNWQDARNCTAAMEYDCPCGEKCLARVGDVIQIYKHRQRFRTRTQQRGSGGNRDVLRSDLAAHYDPSLRTFTNSFVVGNNGRVCERAYAVACSVSEITFQRARADVTKDRAWHADRLGKRSKRESEDRRRLNGWVVLQRAAMEGDKIQGNKWYCEKMSKQQLWNRYVASCDSAGQPCAGNARLLYKIWREHKEYKEVPPTGHAICDTCGMLASDRAALAGLVDEASTEARKKLDEQEAAHHAFHTQEYRYYEAAVTRATHVPEDVTTITIDAPTRHQFDLPSQARSKRDTVKKLDGTHRWQSKLEGVLDAGLFVHTEERGVS